ncbi:MAG TPA: hypothetical protein VGY97_13685 [Solirubrobacteraceae bacterium]|jgi:hypothetical protein|nr:hypothetical protein [Solirubrobacteraceae bacterium]
MCVQCMMSAMGFGAAATGTRSFLATRHFSWLTPRRLRMITVSLLASALIASALVVSGSTPRPPVHGAAAHHPVASSPFSWRSR